MKKIYLLLIIAMLLNISGYSAIWYSSPSGGSIQTLSNWWSTTGGSGSNPTTFATAGDTWIIQSSMTGTTAAWTIGGNLTISSGSLVTSGNTITVGGSFTMSGSTQFNSSSGYNYLYVAGDFIMTGTSYIYNSPSYTYVYLNNTSSTAAAPQNINISSTGSGYWTTMYINSGVYAKLTGNTSFYAVCGTYAPIYVSGTLDCQGYSVTGSTGFTLNSGATLISGSPTGINGAVTTTGTKSYSTTAYYGFDGTSAQVTGTAMPTSVSGIIMNNTSGGVTLSQATTASSLSFTSGILNTSTTNSLTLSASSTAVTGAGTGKYVNGPLYKTISGYSSANYEVGNSSGYLPMLLTFSSAGTSGTLGVTVTNGLHPSLATSGFMATALVNDYWTITNLSAAGPSTVTPKGTYSTTDVVGGGSNSAFKTQKYSSSAWLGSPLTNTNVTTAPLSSTPNSGISLSSLDGDYVFGTVGPYVYATPSSITFPTTVTGTSSAALSFALSGSNMTSSGTLTITPTANFDVSLTGTGGWSSSAITYTYSGTSISSVPIYVRFNPAAAIAYTGTVTVTGGGMPSPVTVALSGNGAAACTSAPIAGTASITPSTGSNLTSFTLSLTGTTVSGGLGGLTYQWQSSSSPTSGFTNISAGTTSTYTFSGLTSNTFYQAVVTCLSYTPATSNTVAATFSLPLSYTGSVGTYTVPAGMTSLKITAKGAQGGSMTLSYPATGGTGAIMSGNFCVTPGQVLKYIVGGQGVTAQYGGGGGGGSFVWDNATGTPLIVAGGGGGASYNSTASQGAGVNASLTTSGTANAGGTGGAGTAGSGGSATSISSYAAGGAGWLSAGVNANTGCSPLATGGSTPLSGGAGGSYGYSASYDGAGGFGGGGGAQGYCGYMGGGGGGGYSGGAPGDYPSYSTGGCGGGSYNSGSGQTNSVGNTGDGSILFTIPTSASGSVSVASLSYPIQIAGTSSSAQTTTFTGVTLSSGGTLTFTAPTGFDVSTSGTAGTYSSTATLSVTGSCMTQTLYIRFSPPSATTYSGNVTITGAGLAAAINVAVSGTGVNVCSGAPTAGGATISPTAGGASTVFTLTAAGYTVAGGITFQWLQSTTGTGSWTSLAGATNATYTFTGITATKYYRCVVTCTASALSDSSNVVSATYLSLPSPCTALYYYSPATSYKMGNFFLNGVGASINDNGTTPAASSGYEDRTTVPVMVTLMQGLTFTGTITYGSPYYYFENQIWIDYNNNGTFETSEAVTSVFGTGGCSYSTASDNFSISVPSTAATGYHRMRVRTGMTYSCTNSSAMDPCAYYDGTDYYYYGTTRDYVVNIIPQPPCGAPTAQPTSLNFGPPTLTTISGSFVPAYPAPQSYLVVATTSSVAPTAPVDGVTYTAGSSALGGLIVANSSTTSFTATGLLPGTTYWFWVYSNTTYCTGGTPPIYLTTSPLSGNNTTTACGISGIKTIGPSGNYSSISAALTDLATYGMGGPVALELQTSYTGETYPITFNGNIPCLSATNRLVIRPQGTMTVTASSSVPIISMNGARYITFDGRVGSTGSTKALTIENTSTSAATIQFINDASYNIFKYCTIKGATTSTSNGVVYFGTTTAFTGSDYNLIDSSDITSGSSLANFLVYGTGTLGKENDHNTISHSNLYDNFYSSYYSYGIFLNSGNSDWTIDRNRFYQTSTRTLSYGGCYYYGAIYISPGTSGNSSGFSITNNIIGYASSTGTGSLTYTATTTCDYLRFIYLSVGIASPSTVSGNTFTAMTLSPNTSSTGVVTAIYHNGGTVNIDSNIIGSNTGTGAINLTMGASVSTGGFVGIYNTASVISALTPATVNIRKNNIGSVTINSSSTTVAGGFYGIYTTSSAQATITDNVIGSTSTSNSIYCPTVTSGVQNIIGIYSIQSSTLSTAHVISNNTIANMTALGNSSSSYGLGIYMQGTSNTSPLTISNNTIYNISTASSNTVYSNLFSVVGIVCYPGSTSTPLVSQNTIYNLANTNSGINTTHVAGIMYAGGLDGTVSRNKIYGLANASTSTSTLPGPTVEGIMVYNMNGGSSNGLTIVNNMITLGTSQTTNTSFTGIMQGIASPSATLRVYYNSVLIEGTASSTTTNNTAAFHRGSYSGTSSTPVDVRNNLFINNRANSAGGTGKHYAIANGISYTASSTGWPANASDYNMLNSSSTATVGYWNGTDQTFTNWKVNASCDLSSSSAATVTFNSPSTGNLHINMGTTANLVESHGIAITGINSDYDNDVRPGPVGSVNGGGFAPDLGADEFDGNPADNIPPAITYTTLLNACGTGDRTFTATLADPAGIPTTGTLRPRVYYKKTTSATWSSSVGTLSSGTGTSGTWSFTIAATDMGGLTIGDIIQYYVIAQDANGYVGSNSPGVIATDVNTVATPPTTPPSYNVLLNLGGSYTVGSTTGSDFTTITSAVSAYNGACLSGPVTFNLVSPAYAAETLPVVINSNSFASATNTLTIRPATGTAVGITGGGSEGAIFKMYNANWVTIDGVNSGGASLTLTGASSSYEADIWLTSPSGTGPGCRNITLKNMNLVGANNTYSYNYGIASSYDYGSTPSFGLGSGNGYDNDSITITGNTFTKLTVGIYAIGYAAVSSGGLDNWTISNNTFGPATSSSTDNIGFRAIMLTNMVNPVISGNLIQNVGYSTSSMQATGVYMNSNVNGALITKNTIKDITSTYTGTGTATNQGIYLGSSVLNSTVTKNVIRTISNNGTTYYSGRGIEINTGSNVSNTVIANNMITRITGKGYNSYSYWPVGIAVEGSTGGLKIYYNAVNLYGNFTGYNGTSGSSCFLITSSGTNIDLRNNAFINSYDNTATSSDKGYAVYSVASYGAGAFSYMNNNDYYVSGPNVMGYYSSDRTNLSGMQTGFGGNTNSINALPVFNDSNDLHLQTIPSNLPMIAGAPVSVTTDFDDTLRGSVTTVIGVHELKLPYCNTITISAGTPQPLVSPLCTQGTTSILPVGVSSALNLTYQWLASDDSVSWSAISGATSRTYSMTTPITGTTFYRLRLGCSLNGAFDSSVTKVIVNPSRILGTSVVCEGLTTTLSDSTGTGTWSAATPSIASIGSASGVVTALAAGTANVTYTVNGTGCYATKVVTVNPLPGSIVGIAQVCEGLTTTLFNPTTGGTWSSASTSLATVGTNGVVSGLAAGVSNITYQLATGCLRVVPVSVNPLPVMSVLPSSSATICFGETAAIKGSAYLPQFSLLSQNFNSGLGTWQITNIAGTSASYWQIYPTGYSGISGDGTAMMVAASEATGGTPTNTILTSPSFSTVGYGAASLTFNQDVISITPDDITADVEYSTNGGSTWTTLTSMLDVISSPGTWSASSPNVTIALPSGMLGQPDVKLRWNYNTNYGFWWALDNIAVKAALPDPTYSWNALGSATGLSCTACDSTNITPTVAGVNLYSVTATTASGCTSSGGLVSVYVNPQPATIGGTATVCEGSTTTLTNATYGGSWTSSDVTKATVNSLTGIVHGEAAGTATITYTLPTGCKSTVTVTVNAAPSAITGTMNVCTGFTTSLSNPTSGGVWSSGAAGTATVDASGVVTGGSAGVAPISYTLSSTTGCSAVANITVNPYPAVITSSSSFAVCETNSINLSSASLGGTWNSSATGIATVDAGSGIVTGAAAGIATISYTLPTGCVRTQDVTVNPTPPSITGTMQVCQFATTTLSDAVTGGTWASGSSTIASVDASGVVTGGTNAGIAAITYTLPTGCKTTANVTVNQLPSAITGVLQVCEGQTTSLFNAATGGTWVSSVTSVATINSSTGVVTGGTAGSTNITYTLSTGCYQSAAVTVNPLPSAIAGALQVCQGASSPLSSSPSGGTWTSGVTGVATIGASSGIATASASMAGISPITYTLPAGCRATANLTVNPLPAPITSSTGSMQVCEGSVAVLSNTTSGGAWNSSNPSVASIDAVTGVALGGSMGNTNITYTLSSTGCARSAVLTVNQSPSAISGTLQVCEGTATPLGNTVGGGTWSSSNTSSAIITSAGIVAGVSYGTSVITYMVNPGSCYKTAVVTVNQLPAVINGTRQVCIGLTTTLGDATTGGTWSSSNTAVAPVSSTGVVSGLATGTATIVYTLPTGCTVNAVITVNGLPAAITGANNVCVGLTTSLGNTTTGGTWSSSNVAVAPVNATTGVVTGIVAGTSTVTYSLPTGCIATANVTVNSLPAAITGSQQVCEGLNTTLSTATSGITWSSSTSAVATVDASIGVVTGNLAGTTIITATSPVGCARTANVTVNPLPAAITGSGVVCQGQTTNLTNSTTGGVWSSGASSVATITSSTGVVTGTGAGTAPVTYTLATGCKSMATVTVNALPAVITGVAQVCTGQTTTLSNTTTGGTWSSASASTATITSAGIVSGVSAGTSTIAYTSAEGCVRNTVLTVNQLPSPISGTMQVCATGTTALSNTVAGGAWSTSTPGVASVSLLSGIVNGVAAGNANITYTLLTGCFQSATVTVNPLPAPIAGTTQVCPGTTTSLSSTTTGGNWSSSSTGIATVSTAGVVSGIAAGNTSIVYTLPLTGCARSATVTVNSLPIVRTVTGGGSYCAGGTGVNVGIDGSNAGVSYMLYNGSATPVTTMTGTGSALSFGLQTGAGTYTVAASDPSTSCGNTMSGSATVSITPVNVPAVTITTGIGDTVCSGNVTTFTASPVGGGSSAAYTWAVNGAAVPSTGTSYSYTPANGDVISVTLTSSAPCSVPASVTDNFTMNVKPMVTPVVNILSTPGSSVCKGSSVTFNAGATYGGAAPTYDWYVNGFKSGSGNVFAYLPINGDVVYCRMHSDYMCRLADSVSSANQNMVTNEVYVPVVNISANPGTTIAYGQPATFTATAIGAGPTPSYQWFIGSTAQYGATSATYTLASSNLHTGDSVICKVTGSGPCGYATLNGVMITGYDLSTGSVTLGNADVRLVPNPNKGAFTVKGTLASDKDEEVTIEVTNMLGQNVYKNTITAKGGNINEQIQLNNTLANGMYMLSLHTSNESKVFHFVLEQ